MSDQLTVIARIRTDFPEKFGLPRQSGLGSEITGRVVFEKPYDTPDALRGIEQFSHLAESHICNLIVLPLYLIVLLKKSTPMEASYSLLNF